MIRRSLAPVLLAGAALAQDAAPDRFVPADAQIVLRCKAPAVWHEQFAKTRLARVFAGASLAPILKKARDDYQPALERAAAVGMPPEVLGALIEDYRGELIVSLKIDVRAAMLGVPDEPSFAAMAVLTPDGKYDLAALAAALRKVHKSGVATKRVALGGHTFDVTTDSKPVAKAEIVDGHLVMFFGNGIEKLAPAMLAATNRSERARSVAPLSLHVELAPLVEAFVQASDSPDRERLGLPSPARLLDVFGLGCFDCFDASLAPDGEHVVLRTSLTTRSTRGWLHDLLVVDAVRPSILRHVPSTAAAFSVTAFDLAALLHVGQAAAEINDGDRDAFAEYEAAFFEKYGVRLRNDLLDHFAGELLTVGSVHDVLAELVASRNEGERPDPNRVLAGVCLGAALHDGAKLAASLDKLLRALGLHAARKTEDYRGAKIHELHVGGALTIEYAITDDLALAVIGTRGAGNDYLRATLDAHAAGRSAPPDAIAKRFADLPPDWNGVGLLPIVELARSVAGLAAPSGRNVSPLATDAMAIVGGLCDELQSLGLGDVVSASYASRDGLRTIYRW